MKKIMFIVLMMLSVSAFAASDPFTKMMKKYGCYSCHTDNKKIVGPSFKDIADKYRGIPSAEDALVTKVSKGSSGVWGSIAMPPNDLRSENQAEIRRMVQYVLRFK